MKLLISIFCLIFFSTQTFASPNATRGRTVRKATVDPVKLLKNQVLKGLPSVEGWCSEEKALALIDLILKEKPKVCVEIGVYGGSSILPIASALKFNGEGTVIAIDPWLNAECTKFAATEGKDVNRDWWAKVDLEAIYQSYLKMIKKFQLNGYTITLRTTSEKAFPAIGTIDLLHIDGNHYEESAYFDVTTYVPKVKEGGYIIMDDTNWNSTSKAVTYLMEHCEHIQTLNDGGCMIFKKI